MAKTTTRKAATTTARATQTSAKAAPKRDTSVMGLPLKTWIETARPAKGAEARSGKRALAFAFATRDVKLIKRTLAEVLAKWQLQMLLESESETSFFQGTTGPVWIYRASQTGEPKGPAALEKSAYAKVRDWAGGIVPALSPFVIDKLIFEFHGLSVEEERGALIGLELASYSFIENRIEGGKSRKTLPTILFKLASPELGERAIRYASAVGLSLNIARHLTNLPGGDLTPRTYADTVENLFSTSRSVKVDVWEGEKLKTENMNLLLAVGAAAADGPRLVHLRYRPAGGTVAQPVAIVGKGVTFDSGGLDIKPASAMRMMKKDMGGSAAAVAIMKWAELTELPMGLDVYLSLAENAIGSRSFRPGDIIVARNGMSVEIHNTDAEGRLVMADALDVAASQEGEDEPQAIFDISTLTGAIKVALGAEIAGLFTNSDDLATLVEEAGRKKGDLAWRMPLFQAYRSQLKSNFAEVANASDGFGGAITAALFLESFVQGKPWAHLDIYAWRDSAGGAWAESGGNGQAVQAMTEVLERIAADAGGGELA